MLGAETDIGVGGEVKHKIATLHRGGERGEVEVVAADEFKAGIFLRTLEEFFLAGRKIIPAGDGDAVREEAIDEAGPDETGGAGDEDVLHEKRD